MKIIDFVTSKLSMGDLRQFSFGGDEVKSLSGQCHIVELQEISYFDNAERLLGRITHDAEFSDQKIEIYRGRSPLKEVYLVNQASKECVYLRAFRYQPEDSLNTKDDAIMIAEVLTNLDDDLQQATYRFDCACQAYKLTKSLSSLEQVTILRGQFRHQSHLFDDEAMTIGFKWLCDPDLMLDYLAFIKSPPTEDELSTLMDKGPWTSAQFSSDGEGSHFNFTWEDGELYTIDYHPEVAGIGYSSNWTDLAIRSWQGTLPGKFIHYCLDKHHFEASRHHAVYRTPHMESIVSPENTSSTAETFCYSHKLIKDFTREGTPTLSKLNPERVSVNRILKMLNLKPPHHREKRYSIEEGYGFYDEKSEISSRNFTILIKKDYFPDDWMSLHKSLVDLKSCAGKSDLQPLIVSDVGDNGYGFLPSDMVLWDPENLTLNSIKSSSANDGAISMEIESYALDVMDKDLIQNVLDNALERVGYRYISSLKEDISPSQKLINNTAFRPETFHFLHTYPALFLATHQALYDVGHIPLLQTTSELIAPKEAELFSAKNRQRSLFPPTASELDISAIDRQYAIATLHALVSVKEDDLISAIKWHHNVGEISLLAYSNKSNSVHIRPVDSTYIEKNRLQDVFFPQAPTESPLLSDTIRISPSLHRAICFGLTRSYYPNSTPTFQKIDNISELSLSQQAPTS